MKKKIWEREREHFLYVKNMNRMRDWQIYSKRMGIRKDKIKED